MSYNDKKYFTKDTLNTCLRELAKEYRRLAGKYAKAEIILVGGAAVLANYGFREMTSDIDAVIHAESSIKDAIITIGDIYNLPKGWINTDFIRTPSYTSKLDEYSVYYRTFSNILTVRTINSEYLIAMKLKSGRQYKNDLSDIAGILKEQDIKNEPLCLEQIKTAYENLYFSWENMPEISRSFIEGVLENNNYTEIYEETVKNEKNSKDILISFENMYPGTAKEENVNEILKILKNKANN